MIRQASERDIGAVVTLYDTILLRQEAGLAQIGWVRGVYPTEQTARQALARNTLFVYEDGGKIVAAAKIDQTQVPEYADCPWKYRASDHEVMVLHTLVVDPDSPHRGYGTAFVRFYEQYALQHRCRCLRMDTNEINSAARSLYQKLGYREAGIVPCNFNGIPNVRLVCLEKQL